MINGQLDINKIIEELGNQISAMSIEIAVLKAKLKAFEELDQNGQQISQEKPSKNVKA